MNQEFTIWHFAMKGRLNALFLLFNEVGSSLIQTLECPDDHRLQEQIY